MEQPIINKYHNGKIYTIRSHQTDKFYIGSTTNALHKRLYHHRCVFKKFQNEKKYSKVSSFEIIKFDDNYIELLEDFKCENKNQLEKREGELIRLHKDKCVNICIAGRTDKQYQIDNAEKLAKYRKDNAEKIAIYKAKYRIDNIEKIAIYQKQPYKCACGSEIRTSDKSQHMKTIKHKNYISTI